MLALILLHATAAAKTTPQITVSRGSKCINCSGDQEATSSNLSRLCWEMNICQKMVRDHSSQNEDAAQLRNVARRSRKPKQSLSPSRTRLPAGASMPAIRPPPQKYYVAVATSASKVQRPAEVCAPNTFGKKYRIYIGTCRQRTLLIGGSSGL